MSAHALEARMAHLEGGYEQINHRLGTVEQRLGALEMKIDSGFSRIDQRFVQVSQRFAHVEQRMDQRFVWTIGLLLVSILLPIVQRFVIH